MSSTAEWLRSWCHYDPETGIFSKPKGVGSRGRAIGGRVLGCLNKESGYIMIRARGALYRAHRLAWLYMTGEWPTHEVDHRDLDKANNAWANLRASTHQQNAFNCKIRKHNRLGVKGVVFHTGTKKFQAVITVSGKKISLGLYRTKELAGCAYRAASEKYHGEFGRPI